MDVKSTEITEINSILTKEILISLVILNILSLLLNFLILWKLQKKINSLTTIIKLLKLGLLAEISQHFCQSIIFLNELIYIKFKDSFQFISKLNFFVYLDIIDLDNSFKFAYNINVNIMFASTGFSFLIQIFYYLEQILTMKNPIGISSLRRRIYVFVGIVVFLLIFIFPLLISKEKFDDFEGFLNIIKENKERISINFILYALSITLGAINQIYTIKRLGFKTFFQQSLYNKFVLGQILMMITYYICMSPFTILAVIFSFNIIPITELKLLLKVFLILYSCLGIVQFFTRILETNVYNHFKYILKKIFCFKSYENRESIESLSSVNNQNLFSVLNDNDEEPISKLLNAMMNFEFISCILFGLKQIYSHKKRNSDVYIMKYNKEKAYDKIESNHKNLEDYIRGAKSLKRHKICYQKLFTNEEIGLSDFNVKNNGKFKKTVLEEYDEINKNKSKSINSSLLSSAVNDQYESHKSHDAIIIEYFPFLFEVIRFEDQIDYGIVLMSLDPLANKSNMLKLKESAGKSGSFFFFSYDKQFIIKTVKEHELEVLKGEFIEKYYKHCMENTDTLLAKIYGLYTIEINNITKIHVILMQNLLSFNTKFVKRIFDLKGSKVDRLTRKIENVSKMQALKDLDFMWMKKVDDELINIKNEYGELIYEVLNKDLSMLVDCELMDYSLLLIIIDSSSTSINSEEKEELEFIFKEPNLIRKIIPSKSGKYYYIVGIIDYLQKYDFKKVVESNFKRLFHNDKASAVDPKLYGYRMRSFLGKNFLNVEIR